MTLLKLKERKIIIWVITLIPMRIQILLCYIEENFKNYLIDITYMENKNVNNNNEHSNKGENGKNKILIDETNRNEVNIYKEILYSDRYKIKYNSYIFKNGNFIGYGLFDKYYKNHYTIMIDDDNIFNSSIHKNGVLDNKYNSEELLKEVDDLIETNFPNFFRLLSTLDEIGGDVFYSDIKLIIANTFKKNNIEFKIIQWISDINTDINNKSDIIYIIRLKSICQFY